MQNCEMIKGMEKPKLIVLQWTDDHIASKGACFACHDVIDVSHLPPEQREGALKSAFSQHVMEKHSGEDDKPVAAVFR